MPPPPLAILDTANWKPACYCVCKAWREELDSRQFSVCVSRLCTRLTHGGKDEPAAMSLRLSTMQRRGGIARLSKLDQVRTPQTAAFVRLRELLTMMMMIMRMMIGGTPSDPQVPRETQRHELLFIPRCCAARGRFTETAGPITFNPEP